MVSAGLRIKRSGFEPWPGHCVVFLGKTLCSHSASLHPGVQMGTSKLSGKPDEMLGGDLRWTSIPSRIIVLGIWGKLRQLSPTCMFVRQ